MLTDNNGVDSTVTVESEKQTITIGNGVSSTNLARPAITVEKEKEILDEIESHCCRWRRIGNAYIIAIIVFGVSAVSTSVLVSIYTGNEKLMDVATVKVMACISTISLGILTAFNLVANCTNSRNAWRSLNAALMLYTAGSISLQQLIEQYQKGESQIGTLSFSYGTATDKPATYAQDIRASHEERKQREANVETRRLKEANGTVRNKNVEAEKQLNGADGPQAIADDK